MNSLWQVVTREEKDYNEYVRNYGGTELLQTSTFAEGVGFLLHRKLLDIDMARELLGEPLKLIWEKNEAVLKKMNADACFWFEYLYNELKKREQQQAIDRSRKRGGNDGRSDAWDRSPVSFS